MPGRSLCIYSVVIGVKWKLLINEFNDYTIPYNIECVIDISLLVGPWVCFIYFALMNIFVMNLPFLFTVILWGITYVKSVKILTLLVRRILWIRILSSNVWCLPYHIFSILKIFSLLYFDRRKAVSHRCNFSFKKFDCLSTFFFHMPILDVVSFVIKIQFKINTVTNAVWQVASSLLVSVSSLEWNGWLKFLSALWLYIKHLALPYFLVKTCNTH